MPSRSTSSEKKDGTYKTTRYLPSAHLLGLLRLVRAVTNSREQYSNPLVDFNEQIHDYFIKLGINSQTPW